MSMALKILYNERIASAILHFSPSLLPLWTSFNSQAPFTISPLAVVPTYAPFLPIK